MKRVYLGFLALTAGFGVALAQPGPSTAVIVSPALNASHFAVPMACARQECAMVSPALGLDPGRAARPAMKPVPAALLAPPTPRPEMHTFPRGPEGAA